VNAYGNRDALENNVKDEYEQNFERYKFLKWAQKSFDNFRVVPPGMGICHQVNLEYLASVFSVDRKNNLIYPDTVVGTDSHTTMINGLGVLGWGVGGIEAEAVMLNQPISMNIPDVVGFKLTGKLRPGVTATDLVLYVTEILRKKKVVGKFVEFFGDGLKNLSLPDRATIANMSPEYGATCGFFPIDEKTLEYLKLTARSEEKIALIKEHAEHEGLFNDYKNNLCFTDIVELDLSTVNPSLAGPKRPQDRCDLKNVYSQFIEGFPEAKDLKQFKVENEHFTIQNSSVVLAAITSCTNTSNPAVLIAAALMAKKAVEFGITSKPWVKTSFAPGSRVVTEYLESAGLQKYLDAIGFNVVGYGCTTCIGNSGPLDQDIENTIKENDLCVAGVLSGNRNFEGRIHPLIKANFLASPPLVVAFALAGKVNINLEQDIINYGFEGQEIRLKDIWPSDAEIEEVVNDFVKQEYFKQNYETIFDGEKTWQGIEISESMTYSWDEKSTYIRRPTYLDNFNLEKSASSSSIRDVQNARILCLLGDSITTDHISPAGSIKEESPAGLYLKSLGVLKNDFNSYGSRRGNHEVMMRGTFANTRLKNEIMIDVVGGFTKYFPSGEPMYIYDAAMKYKSDKVPLVIFAGKEYGTGSSRDWAAKGVLLLGVKAVIAESFERIHRSNLVGMGVLPCIFKDGETRLSLGLKGDEVISIDGISKISQVRQELNCKIKYQDGTEKLIQVKALIETDAELEIFKCGGIMQHVLAKI
jgi:aconitate hydratase